MAHAGTQRLWCNLGDGVRPGALVPLLRKLIETHPGLEVRLTASRGVTLPDQLPQGIVVLPRPADLRQLADRFLRDTEPDLAVFAGRDLMLSAVPACRERDIPVVLLSARAPDGATLRERFADFRMRGRLRLFNHVLAATEADAARFRTAGGDTMRVEVLGDLGFLADPLPYDPSESEALAALCSGRPTWAAVHVAPDEIEAVERAHREASRLSHRLLLIVSPSDPAITPELAAHFAERGWATATRSENEDPHDDVQIFIADLPDELGLWYRLAPISFIGSSLHSPASPANPFDAAALGSAIIHGPQMALEEETANLNRSGASRLIRSGSELAEALVLLLSPDRCARQAHRAWEVTSSGAEASERAARVIGGYLERMPA